MKRIKCTRNGEITYEPLSKLYEVWEEGYSRIIFHSPDVKKTYDFYDQYIKELLED
tara:strand:- start:4428 stop:4595 length:168 start_codon:yes stop_codon:yes gene_type:complete